MLKDPSFFFLIKRNGLNSQTNKTKINLFLLLIIIYIIKQVCYCKHFQRWYGIRYKILIH